MAKSSEPVIQEKGKSAIDTSILDTIDGKLPSQKGQMDIMSILKKGLEARKTGMPFEMFASLVGARMKSPRNSMVKINNTAFMVRREPNDSKKVEFSMISADSSKNASKCIMGFYKFLKNQKILSASTTEETPQFVELYKNSGVPLKVSVTEGFYGKERKPEYLITFDMRRMA